MADRVGQQLGNYRLTHLLGRGGFAEVYLAQHLALNTQVAIKILHTQLASADAERFQQEARTIANLVHPHIVRVFDFAVQDGTPYLVMDYAPNGTLRLRHPRGTALPPATILAYVRQIADALQYAHDQRLIHRDIKPENILVGRNTEVLLSDFGIATIAQTTSDIKTQGFAGTATYAAPEQLRGKPVQASDQYALATVIYEWLSGDTPFHGAPLEVATQQVLSPPPPLREKLPGIAPDVEQVVMTALSKEPKERFGSVRAFATALEQAMQAAPAVFSDYGTPVAPGAAQPEQPGGTSIYSAPTQQTPSTPSAQPGGESIYYAPTQRTPQPSAQPGNLPTIPTQGTPPDNTPVPPGAQGGWMSGGQAAIPPGWASGAPPGSPPGTPPYYGAFNTPPSGETFAAPTPTPGGPGGYGFPPGQALQTPPARPGQGKWIAAVVGGVLVVVLIVALVIARGLPGSGSQTGGQASPTTPPTARPTKALPGGMLCMGTDFPVSDTDAIAGQPAEDGADLAVRQNANLGSGYTLQVRNFNDVSAATGVHDRDQGAQNVQQMVQTPCILAMVGPFNSSVAGKEIPIAADAGLVMISPANTNPGLTLQQYAAENGFDYATLHPAGKPNVYFRIPGNDVAQGKVDADFTIGAQPNGLGEQRVYVIDDSEIYGKGLADFFSQEFTAKGGTIPGRDEITATSWAQLPQLAAKIVATNPDAVFYGGVTAYGGGLLKAQLVQDGFTGPMVGGDGIAGDPGFITQAGSAANNTYATVSGPDLSTFTTGAGLQFVNDYRAAFGSDPTSFSALAFDAAMIEIQAIKQIINAGNIPTRALMISQIQNIQYDGITGHISFDQNGDNSGQKVFSIYEVLNGQWQFLKEVNA